MKLPEKHAYTGNKTRPRSTNCKTTWSDKRDSKVLLFRDITEPDMLTHEYTEINSS